MWCRWRLTRCPRLVVHLSITMVAIHAGMVAVHTWMVASHTGSTATHTVVVAVHKLVVASLDTLDRRTIQWVVAQDLVAWYTHLVVDTHLVQDHMVASHKWMAWYTQLVVTLDTWVATLVAGPLGNSLETLVVVVVVTGGVAVEVATPLLDESYATDVVV